MFVKCLLTSTAIDPESYTDVFNVIASPETLLPYLESTDNYNASNTIKGIASPEITIPYLGIK